MAGRRSSAHQCVNLINDMYGILSKARRAFIGQDSYVISKQEMLEKLDQLRATLPEALTQAIQYVDAHEQILQQAEQDCRAKRTAADQEAGQKIADADHYAADKMSKADQQASATVAQANQTAQQTIAQATQEATAIMEGARAEAQRVMQDAAAKADQMVEEEEILRRARAAAGEATADAQAEMARLRQMTFDYLDNVMDHIDRSLSESLSDLRMERNELNNHR